MTREEKAVIAALVNLRDNPDEESQIPWVKSGKAKNSWIFEEMLKINWYVRKIWEKHLAQQVKH